jgi:hypothetical protein
MRKRLRFLFPLLGLILVTATGSGASARTSERSADLNANTPFEQPEGPHLTFVDGAGSFTDGWDYSQWWVTPLPPPGPVQITIHLGGRSDVTGSGYLDGQAIAEAGSRAQ